MIGFWIFGKIGGKQAKKFVGPGKRRRRFELPFELDHYVTQFLTGTKSNFSLF